MERFQANGSKKSPGEIESAYRELLRDREIRANLTRLQATGARVEYHSLDVRNRTALSALVADAVARFGRIDGVVHGAGVIEDKLLRDKTPESFDRVFGVKVQSAWALSELLDPEELKFCVFFASIASRYGNRGQSDYAAANEVLSKLALELDRRWPARVFSIAWGPWRQVGMVADLEPHLEARGVALIDPAVGAQRFIEELEFGWKGESEVLIAGGAEHVAKPPVRASEAAAV
jgi:NAD(P)-dependent dehydrogenase (short-subunit alcohol dehydrogenase family)